MDLELQWLLLGLPLAFALGWAASRIDLRQLSRQRRDAPHAYFDGLTLLLQEQPDKAIDAFIEAVQLDPADTTELHFALGHLFRRRGEFERAVRVHEHLMQRGDLRGAVRDRARLALAEDYLKAGLFDRAETAFRALAGTAHDAEAQRALLSLAERSHDWPVALALARRLDTAAPGSMAVRIAHHECELALLADARDAGVVGGEGDAALQRACAGAPTAPRPLLLRGRRAMQRGDAAAACDAWEALLLAHPGTFLLVADEHAAAALACGRAAQAQQALLALHDQLPAVELLQALQRLAGDDDAAWQALTERLQAQLSRQPTAAAVRLWLSWPIARQQAVSAADAAQALARAARPLQRYRCAACGFEADGHFWQCPGCLTWDSFPPQRLEAL